MAIVKEKYKDIINRSTNSGAKIKKESRSIINEKNDYKKVINKEIITNLKEKVVDNSLENTSINNKTKKKSNYRTKASSQYIKIGKEKAPNLKNYSVNGTKRKKLNLVRKEFKVLGETDKIIEEVKLKRLSNFSKVRSEYFKRNYKKILANEIEKLNSSNGEIDSLSVKQSTYNAYTLPKDLKRTVRSIRRISNSSKKVISKINKSDLKFNKIKGDGVSRIVNDRLNMFKDSEDESLKSIYYTKESVSIGYKSTKVATKGIKYGINGSKAIYKASLHSIQVAKTVSSKIMSNPMIIKGVTIVVGILLLLTMFSSIIQVLFGGMIGNESKYEPVETTQEQRAFIYSIIPQAQKNYEKYNILPSITIAQAIHESDWGRSDLAREANNLFGVKADSSWTGETIEMLTEEVINGESVMVVAKWRKYKTIDSSIEDHGLFLFENERYSEVLKAKDYREQAYLIRLAGYATDPEYADKIVKTIENYSLFLYDFNINGEANETIERAIGIGSGIVGKSPYVWGGGRNEEDIKNLRFDCSSFVHWCFASAGLELGDYKGVTTYTLVKLGKEIPVNEMKRGDLIFFDTEGIDTHVGIYIGNGEFLHDAEPNGVWIDSLDNTYWKSAFNGKVRRVIE